MFVIGEPNDQDVRRFVARQRELPFTYAEVGATNTTPPSGYTVDHNRTQLGSGEEAFRRAVDALKLWQHFDLGWVTIVPQRVAIEVGATVAVKAQTLGVWSLSACRVVYVIEQPRRFGFAYGTLPDHVERGEERFLVEWLDDDSVWYDILAFSRPRHPLVRLGSPYARTLQKQFARDSLNRMKNLAADNTD